MRVNINKGLKEQKKIYQAVHMDYYSHYNFSAFINP